MKVKDIIQYTEWIPNPRYSDVTPRFSIFMPTFRRGASGHLEKAIQSVLRQTFHDFELIIIDDASVDGSFDIIKKYIQSDPRVQCLHHPRNVGLPALSCYEAYKVSRGEYLMFCFDDAEYLPDVLENVDRYIQNRKFKIAFGYIDRESLSEDGSIAHYFVGKDDVPQANLEFTNFLPNMGAIIHRSVPEEIGFLDPHLSIAGLVDWDYWKRAAKVYELQRMNIHFGTEYGLTTGNSLGLTYPLGSWLAYEWSDLERNEALKPGNYEEYDVQSIPLELSYLARQTLLDMKQVYASRFWCAMGAEDFSRTASFEHGKILVIFPELTASISLPFQYLSKRYFRFIAFSHLDFKEVINAQAVILSRALSWLPAQSLIQICEALKIPIYYYTDDNFVSLSDEISEFKEYTPENLRIWLKNFSGVLVSTPALREFFLKEQIHDNVFVFPPVLPDRTWLDYPAIPPKPAEVVRIAVLSGRHRYRNFLEHIQPAIERLAQEYKIEMVVPEDFSVNIKGVSVYKYPIDYSYNLMLGRLMSADIDILLHPASFTKNNLYKTLNVLINAWAIHAVPVLANQPPYENVERDGLGFLCISDAVDSWYEKLKHAISDSAHTEQIKENLDSFLRREYSGKMNEEVVEKILSELPILGFATIENRYRSYLSILSKSTLPKPAQEPSLEGVSTYKIARILISRVKIKITALLHKIIKRFLR